MTAYSLDTNACITLINGRPLVLRERFSQAHAAGNTFAVSSVVIFELQYGVAKSQHPEATGARLAAFLVGSVETLSFDEDDAGEAGLVRAALERDGQPIGAYDLLIAGQARRRGLTVVTANIAEFRRVVGLAWEDWAN